MNGVTVEIHDAGVYMAMDGATDLAVFAAAEQALKSCNFYCKEDIGSLKMSASIHSDLRQGVLRWVTPYAEMQYEFVPTRTDKNPNATYEWCDTAYANHGDEWERAFVNALHRGGA